MPESSEPQFLRETKNELDGIGQEGLRLIRARKSLALKSAKENMVEKQGQMSSLIAKLYEKVYERAGANQAQLLMDLVKGHEAEYGALDAESSEILQHALTEYNAKHDKAGFYYRQYEKKPEELFERCFGQKPKGKIQLILGPMTLCFRCFNQEDYIAAYVNHGHEDKKTTDYTDPRSKAIRSQGAAFSHVKVADLAGAVIIEKASNNCVVANEYKTNEVVLERNKATEIKFSDMDLASGLGWIIGNARHYEFSFMGSEQVRLYDFSKGEDVFDFRPLKPGFTYRLELPAEKFRDTEYIDITIGPKGLSFVDHSRKQHIIQNDRLVGKKLILADEKLSKEVRRHEEQHQFNKLFVPKEEYMGISPSYMQSLEKVFNGNDLELAKKAKEKIVITLARHYRRIYIDDRARDEIIAYYKGSRDLDSVAKTLKTSPLYDYAAEKVELTTKRDVTYDKWIKEMVFKDLGQGGQVDYITYSKEWANESKKTRMPLKAFIPREQFTKEFVEQMVDQTLKGDYAKSIDRWLEQIKILEKMGYGRQQIVAFCNMLPVRSWEAFVRRLNKKSNAATKA